MKKKILSFALMCTMAVSMLAGCGSAKKDDSFKVGVILVGDETESYTLAHMEGIKAAAKKVGIEEKDILWKEKVEETEEAYNSAKALVAQGCKIVISNSYGHQEFMAQAAEEYKDVNFVAMTGDFAAISGLDNLYNAFTAVYESRYVSGVVAGMKLAELVADNKLPETAFDADGNIKIGYVGAYPYAEVKSGYTAFFLGIRSVVENVSMQVQYTSSWFDIEKEAAAADTLIKNGCVIIGQHADSTGAPDKVQSYYDNGTVVYSVGYNVDMLQTAPKAALTSATNVWEAYYERLLSAAVKGEKLPQDLALGYADGGVTITALGPDVAAGTAEKVAEVEAAIKAGTLHVFDTSTFTVNGETLTTCEKDLSFIDFSTMQVVYQGEKVETIQKDGDVSFFDESKFRSAPYFDLIIDGITELNAN